jgi:hypothetical protein
MTSKIIIAMEIFFSLIIIIIIKLKIFVKFLVACHIALAMTIVKKNSHLSPSTC